MTDREIAQDIVGIMRIDKRPFTREQLATHFETDERVIRRIIAEIILPEMHVPIVTAKKGYYIAQSPAAVITKVDTMRKVVISTFKHMKDLNNACQHEFGEANKEAEQLELI